MSSYNDPALPKKMTKSIVSGTSLSHFDGDMSANKLQDLVKSKKQDVKELKGRIIFLENDNIMEKQKTSLLLSENNQLRSDLDRLKLDLKQHKNHEEQTMLTSKQTLQRMELLLQQTRVEVESL